MNNRYAVKVVGESGQGVNSIGEVLDKSLKDIGLYIFGYREYPSLIKGGYASYQIDMASSKINASSSKTKSTSSTFISASYCLMSELFGSVKIR